MACRRVSVISIGRASAFVGTAPAAHLSLRCSCPSAHSRETRVLRKRQLKGVQRSWRCGTADSPIIPICQMAMMRRRTSSSNKLKMEEEPSLGWPPISTAKIRSAFILVTSARILSWMNRTQSVKKYLEAICGFIVGRNVIRRIDGDRSSSELRPWLTDNERR